MMHKSTLREIAGLSPDELDGWVLIDDRSVPSRDSDEYPYWAMNMYYGSMVQKIRSVVVGEEGRYATVNGSLLCSADHPVFRFEKRGG